MYYALLQHRFRFFGLVKRYNFIGTFSSYDAAARFGRDVMGFGEGTFTVRPISAAQKNAMTITLIG